MFYAKTRGGEKYFFYSVEITYNMYVHSADAFIYRQLYKIEE